MGAAFLITLREGVEIALIISILLAYLARVNRRDMFGAVWVGIASAVVVCAGIALAFQRFVGDFTGKAEQLTEGIVAIAAASMLTYMIFWMRKHARGSSAGLQTRLAVVIEHSFLAVALFAAVSVLREGIETALLLLGATEQSQPGWGFTVGGVAGLAAATWIGYAFYAGSRQINLKRFFSATALLLILFAAGMAGKAAHEFAEYAGLGGSLVEPVWHVTNAAFSTSWFAQFLNGMFGWSPHPELIRVLVYFSYLLPVTALYFGGIIPIPRMLLRRSESSRIRA